MPKQTSSFPPSGSLRNGESRSQALLEFALALPVLLMIIFGIIDFALIFQAWLSVENIARQTIRYAVTGEYDPIYCSSAPAADGTPDCAGTSYIQEQDYARLQSIKADAQHWEVALLSNSTTDKALKGYLNVTVCSSRDANRDGLPDFDFHPLPQMASSIYARCVLSSDESTVVQDAGGPGDHVLVFVDFNHPLITPFLSQVWPMIHLVSYRDGVVETFRTSHSIAQAGEGVLDTPTASDTPTPSDTPTITPTPTNTDTPIPPTGTATLMPIYVAIINPAVSGTVISSASNTAFEAVAWDPNVGTTNGQGISNVVFAISGPGGYSYSHQENIAAYCVWAGDSPCAVMTDADFAALAPGTYTLSATATGLSGGMAVDWATFVIPVPPTATVTNTPTKTPVTPTKTNTPVTPTKTNTPVTPSKTNTPVTPSKTNTPVTPSKTPTITFTPSKTPTKTPVTPSLTPSKTPTKTPVTPTNTKTPVTPTKTFTATPVTPTNTPTPVTPTKTNTPVTPTNTPTPVTPTKTNTPVTPTKTNTPVTPSLTPTPITPTKTPTPIPLPSATNTTAPTRTPPGGGG